MAWSWAWTEKKKTQSIIRTPYIAHNIYYINVMWCHFAWAHIMWMWRRAYFHIIFYYVIMLHIYISTNPRNSKHQTQAATFINYIQHEFIVDIYFYFLSLSLVAFCFPPPPSGLSFLGLRRRITTVFVTFFGKDNNEINSGQTSALCKRPPFSILFVCIVFCFILRNKRCLNFMSMIWDSLNGRFRKLLSVLSDF